ncbi:LPXTG cell wall anchor domain-containing protein [Streptomyces vilmorinianum]|uniref:LPXTG cell wall anchor domain-containing protein n=1 Tax=Streptomyces vilmorinianum TaxID=3051092 RepID=UPI0010FAF934|nr:LPXTG cell wall anchor domain-containing protein [Streptomyces vilmorinianum]
MRRSLISAGALVAAMAGSLVLAPAASAAEVPFHHEKDLPLTAAEFENEGNEECPGIPDDKDGWHFVLPGKDADFTKLTVTFDNGTPLVITDFSSFGNPEGKHAYVASAPGAELTAATAEIDGEAKFFNLSHTCPSSATPTPTPTTTETTPEESPSSSESPSESTSPSSSVSPTESASAGATPSASTSVDAEGDLAETGSSAPVGIIAAAAVALAGAGAFLVTRRRKAQQH